MLGVLSVIVPDGVEGWVKGVFGEAYHLVKAMILGTTPSCSWQIAIPRLL